VTLLTLAGIQLDYGDQTIFRDAELSLDAGERVCLVGRNGAGKSTLLKIITGDVTPDAGEVRRRANLRVAQLEQALPSTQDVPVRDYVASGLAAHRELLGRYRELTQTDLQDADVQDLETLQRGIEAHGGWDTEARIEAILSVLGLPSERRLGQLSGGWQRRVALARALVGDPDLLLLDEPTNHLDLAAIEWLEERVRTYRGAVLFITHDRAFLKALATRIVDIDRGRLRSWPADYARYVELKEQALETEERANAVFDKKLAAEEIWIRQGIKARRTRNEGRVRALERLRAEFAARTAVPDQARIRVQEALPSSRRVIEARQVDYSVAGRQLIRCFTQHIARGERIGLIGNNGVGKSTLLRLLLGELEPDAGVVRQGEQLEVAYFDQLRRELDPAKTVADVVAEGRDHVLVEGRALHVISYLRDFLFSARRVQTPIGVLSGGERNRVVLARLFARPSNLLVLDEPTNDLDVETLEVLEAQLAQYAGTIILVSHDRTFLDNVVTATLVFEAGGAIVRHAGGYSDWARLGRALAVDDAPDARAAAPKPAAPSATARRPTKLSYKLEVELNALPSAIEDLETELAHLEAETARAGFYEQPYGAVEATLARLATLRSEIERAMARWDELETLKRDLAANAGG